VTRILVIFLDVKMLMVYSYIQDLHNQELVFSDDFEMW